MWEKLDSINGDTAFVDGGLRVPGEVQLRAWCPSEHGSLLLTAHAGMQGFCFRIQKHCTWSVSSGSNRCVSSVWLQK